MAYKHLFARPEKVLISSGWREFAENASGGELRMDLGILIMANIEGFLCAASGAAIASLAMSTAVLADDEAPKFGYSITISGVRATTSSAVFRSTTRIRHSSRSSNSHTASPTSTSGALTSQPLGDPFELDIVRRPKTGYGPVTWDIGVLYYTYPNSPASPSDLDYVEFKVGGSITPMTNLSRRR